MRRGPALVTRVTFQDASTKTMAIGSVMPKVWTERQRVKSMAVRRDGGRPRSPRARSRWVVGTSTCHRSPRAPAIISDRMIGTVVGGTDARSGRPDYAVSTPKVMTPMYPSPCSAFVMMSPASKIPSESLNVSRPVRAA